MQTNNIKGVARADVEAIPDRSSVEETNPPSTSTRSTSDADTQQSSNSTATSARTSPNPTMSFSSHSLPSSFGDTTVGISINPQPTPLGGNTKSEERPANGTRDARVLTLQRSGANLNIDALLRRSITPKLLSNMRLATSSSDRRRSEMPASASSSAHDATVAMPQQTTNTSTKVSMPISRTASDSTSIRASASASASPLSPTQAASTTSPLTQTTPHSKQYLKVDINTAVGASVATPVQAQKQKSQQSPTERRPTFPYFGSQKSPRGNPPTSNATATVSTASESASPSPNNKQQLFKLSTHSHHDYGDANVVLNPEQFPHINEGDIIQISHATATDADETTGPSRSKESMLFEVHKTKPVLGTVQLSVQRAITTLKMFNFKNYEQVHVRKVEDIAQYEVSFLEVTFKDKYVSQGDFYRIKLKLEGTPVYVGGKLTVDRVTIHVAEIISGVDTRVSCGIITQNTKFVFRSRSARLFWLVQMSKEMWDFSQDGQLNFERFANQLLTDIFERWMQTPVSHSLTLVFFTRTMYNMHPRAEDLGEILCSDVAHPLKNQVVVDHITKTRYDGRTYIDMYHNVCENECLLDWHSLKVLIKQEFHRFPHLCGWSIPGTANQDGDLSAPVNSPNQPERSRQNSNVSANYIYRSVRASSEKTASTASVNNICRSDSVGSMDPFGQHQNMEPNNNNNKMPTTPTPSLSRAYVHGVPSSAQEGNVLEAINLCLNVLDKHYMDRDLKRTGQAVVLFTPGAGIFEVDRRLTQVIKQRMMDNAIGCDVISLTHAPLHMTPLFVFEPAPLTTVKPTLDECNESTGGESAVSGSITPAQDAPRTHPGFTQINNTSVGNTVTFAPMSIINNSDKSVNNSELSTHSNNNNNGNNSNDNDNNNNNNMESSADGVCVLGVVGVGVESDSDGDVHIDAESEPNQCRTSTASVAENSDTSVVVATDSAVLDVDAEGEGNELKVDGLGQSVSNIGNSPRSSFSASAYGGSPSFQSIPTISSSVGVTQQQQEQVAASNQINNNNDSTNQRLNNIEEEPDTQLAAFNVPHWIHLSFPFHVVRGTNETNGSIGHLNQFEPLPAARMFDLAYPTRSGIPLPLVVATRVCLGNWLAPSKVNGRCTYPKLQRDTHVTNTNASAADATPGTSANNGHNNTVPTSHTRSTIGGSTLPWLRRTVQAESGIRGHNSSETIWAHDGKREDDDENGSAWSRHIANYNSDDDGMTESVVTRSSDSIGGTTTSPLVVPSRQAMAAWCPLANPAVREVPNKMMGVSMRAMEPSKLNHKSGSYLSETSVSGDGSGNGSIGDADKSVQENDIIRGNNTVQGTGETNCVGETWQMRYKRVKEKQRKHDEALFAPRSRPIKGIAGHISFDGAGNWTGQNANRTFVSSASSSHLSILPRSVSGPISTATSLTYTGGGESEVSLGRREGVPMSINEIESDTSSVSNSSYTHAMAPSTSYSSLSSSVQTQESYASHFSSPFVSASPKLQSTALALPGRSQHGQQRAISSAASMVSLSSLGSRQAEEMFDMTRQSVPRLKPGVMVTPGDSSGHHANFSSSHSVARALGNKNAQSIFGGGVSRSLLQRMNTTQMASGGVTSVFARRPSTESLSLSPSSAKSFPSPAYTFARQSRSSSNSNSAGGIQDSSDMANFALPSAAAASVTSQESRGGNGGTKMQRSLRQDRANSSSTAFETNGLGGANDNSNNNNINSSSNNNSNSNNNKSKNNNNNSGSNKNNNINIGGDDSVLADVPFAPMPTVISIPVPSLPNADVSSDTEQIQNNNSKKNNNNTSTSSTARNIQQNASTSLNPRSARASSFSGSAAVPPGTAATPHSPPMFGLTRATSSRIRAPQQHGRYKGKPGMASGNSASGVVGSVGGGVGGAGGGGSNSVHGGNIMGGILAASKAKGKSKGDEEHMNPFRLSTLNMAHGFTSSNRNRWAHLFPHGRFEEERATKGYNSESVPLTLESYRPNWKSLRFPGVLPLTTSFVPHDSVLQNEFHVRAHNFNASLEQNVQASPDESPTLNDRMLEIICQRLSQDFQLYVPNSAAAAAFTASAALASAASKKDNSGQTGLSKRAAIAAAITAKQAARRAAALASMPSKRKRGTFDVSMIHKQAKHSFKIYLTMGHEVHEISYDYNARSTGNFIVNEHTQTKRDSVVWEYSCLMFEPLEQRFGMVRHEFTQHQAPDNWNKLDGMLSGSQTEVDFSETPRYRRQMYSIVPRRPPSLTAFSARSSSTSSSATTTTRSNGSSSHNVFEDTDMHEHGEQKQQQQQQQQQRQPQQHDQDAVSPFRTAAASLVPPIVNNAATSHPTIPLPIPNAAGTTDVIATSSSVPPRRSTTNSVIRSPTTTDRTESEGSFEASTFSPRSKSTVDATSSALLAAGAVSDSEPQRQSGLKSKTSRMRRRVSAGDSSIRMNTHLTSVVTGTGGNVEEATSSTCTSTSASKTPNGTDTPPNTSNTHPSQLDTLPLLSVAQEDAVVAAFEEWRNEVQSKTSDFIQVKVLRGATGRVPVIVEQRTAKWHLRPRSSGRAEWMILVYDSVFTPYQCYHMEMRWLVASSSTILSDVVMPLTRVATRVKLNMQQVPEYCISTSASFQRRVPHAFILPKFIAFQNTLPDNPPLVAVVMSALQSRFDFVLDSIHEMRQPKSQTSAGNGSTMSPEEEVARARSRRWLTMYQREGLAFVHFINLGLEFVRNGMAATPTYQNVKFENTRALVVELAETCETMDLCYSILVEDIFGLVWDALPDADDAFVNADTDTDTDHDVDVNVDTVVQATLTQPIIEAESNQEPVVDIVEPSSNIDGVVTVPVTEEKRNDDDGNTSVRVSVTSQSLPGVDTEEPLISSSMSVVGPEEFVQETVVPLAVKRPPPLQAPSSSENAVQEGEVDVESLTDRASQAVLVPGVGSSGSAVANSHTSSSWKEGDRFSPPMRQLNERLDEDMPLLP